MAFKDIIGQDIAIKALKNIIAQDQVRGSYLFFGPDGVGKRTVGIEFSKAINCEYEKLEACDKCFSCNKINSTIHPDVFIVYPEGPSDSIKIQRIRELIYQASLKPYEGKKRIFIINDAETMTLEAQNALLKLLEEPPRNHILILTASNISGLVPTVLSRCKVLKFYSLHQLKVQEFLHGHDVEEKDASLFSHMAMGSIGRAMAFKDSDLISRRDQVVNDFFFRKSVLLREGALNEEVAEDVEESLYMLLCWYRDLLVSKFTSDSDMVLNIDRYEDISSYSGRFTREKLQKDILMIINTIRYVRMNINPKIALFNMAVGLRES